MTSATYISLDLILSICQYTQYAPLLLKSSNVNHFLQYLSSLPRTLGRLGAFLSRDSSRQLAYRAYIKLSTLPSRHSARSWRSEERGGGWNYNAGSDAAAASLGLPSFSLFSSSVLTPKLYPWHAGRGRGPVVGLRSGGWRST